MLRHHPRVLVKLAERYAVAEPALDNLRGWLIIESHAEQQWYDRTARSAPGGQLSCFQLHSSASIRGRGGGIHPTDSNGRFGNTQKVQQATCAEIADIAQLRKASRFEMSVNLK
jgi:hypothetical protein